MKKFLLGGMGVFLAMNMAACGQPEAPAAQEPPAAETPAFATPVPVATPSPAQRAEALESAFRDLLVIEASAYEIQPTLQYADMIAQIETWRGLEQALYDATQSAYAAACEQTGQVPGECRVEPVSWKLVASLYHRFGPEAQRVLARGCALAVTPTDAGADLRVSYSDLRGLIESETGEARFGAKLTYAYLNTVYDDDGEEISFEQYPLSEEYLKNLQDPLPGKHIKDGWYNDRDRGKRKHTGTDIRAPEDTPIFSCTDGTVININVNSGAGNYVVVLDDEGFEYHYYHMVRLTDFLHIGDRVQKGDVVGHVGNTGNSSANHLHLTVISPDYRYINPYLMLRDMRKLQKSN